MDERQLKKILEDIEIPASDENAKKRAVNMAVAEFERHQKEKEKKFQGMPLLDRLMGKSNAKRRSEPMNRKFIYGGMATALAVVLAVGVSYDYLFQTVGDGSVAKVQGFSSVKDAAVSREVDVSEAYRTAVEERNTNRIENAIRSRGTATPAPAGQYAAKKEAKPQMYGGRAASDMAAAPPPMAQSLAAEPSERMAMPAPVIMADEASAQWYQDVGRDQFKDFKENPVKLVSEEAVSTFSIDVDTTSYSFVRRQINHAVLPQKDAVRIEELINYFDYDYPLPETKEVPFKPIVAVTPSPWAEGKKLIHIGIKGYDIAPEEKPRSNLVFLLDVSGSMNAPDKLPLVKNAMKMLLDTLEPEDTVGIVVYAGAAGTVLEPTKVSEKSKIIEALERLSAGGSTAGGQGIQKAYQLAESNFDENAVNRVILATDGDFNVGITSRQELQDFVERKRETGIFLSVLGFGQGNLNDHTMQALAQNGNGVAAYIDSLSEARKVLVDEATGMLFPIAKDVKIQVEFNPGQVAEYRLIGYETRHLNREDFNNDAVDAGDIGAGHTVTAIYEITPVGSKARMIDESRYGNTQETKADTDFGGEYAFLKIRYKLPEEDTSNLITQPIAEAHEFTVMEEVPEWLARETGWAAAVAGFGQLLKGGKYTGDFDYDDVIALAQQTKGADEFGYRTEFIQMVRNAELAAAMQAR